MLPSYTLHIYRNSCTENSIVREWSVSALLQITSRPTKLQQFCSSIEVQLGPQNVSRMPDLSQILQKKNIVSWFFVTRTGAQPWHIFTLFFRGLKTSQKTKSAGLQPPTLLLPQSTHLPVSQRGLKTKSWKQQGFSPFVPSN